MGFEGRLVQLINDASLMNDVLRRFFGPLAIALLVLLPVQSVLATEPAVLDYRVVNSYPHDRRAFTQGLLFRDGWLYESTGQRGASSIRKVDLESGRVARQYDLPSRYFGEGIVDWGDSLVAVTWTSGQGFVFGIEDFAERRRFAYVGQGWGLTRNDSHIVMSDGSSTLKFLSPLTFKTQKTLSVTLDGKPLRKLNELEWVEGDIFANVWQTDWIVRIDPSSGVVTGIADLSQLMTREQRSTARADVLNGIAYDAQTGRLFVTGKYWPRLFEIALSDQDVK